MVRPIQKDEQDENQFKFGDLGGFMGGGSNFAATEGGKFAGNGEGTGFVNASDYLSANKGKGVALGEDLTKDATAATDEFNKGVDEFSGIDTSYNPGEDKFADVLNDPMAGDHIVSRPARTGAGPGFPGQNYPGPKIPSTAMESRKIPGRASGEFAQAEEYYKNGSHAYKGPKADEINAKYNSLDKLRLGHESIAKTFDPKTPEGRTLRESKLDQKAKDSGLTYGSGSRGFDAMFMEAENPDLFKKKYDGLTGALERFKGLDGVLQEKVKGASASTEAGAAYDAERALKASQEGKKARDREDAVTTKAPKPGSIPVPIDPMNDANGYPTNPDVWKNWTYDAGTKTYHDIAPDGTIRVVDENGQPVNNDGFFD